MQVTICDALTRLGTSNMYLHIDAFESKPRISILLNVQEGKKKRMENLFHFNAFDFDKMRF